MGGIRECRSRTNPTVLVNREGGLYPFEGESFNDCGRKKRVRGKMVSRLNLSCIGGPASQGK